MTDVVVLLRGLNLGRHNRVPMARLRAALEARGVGPVRTYVASGNVLCPAAGRVDEMTRLVAAVVADDFGVEVAATARTRAELRAARGAFPFDIHDPRLCAISFLDREPDAPAVAALGARDFGGDRCEVIGREVHERFESGVHGSSMTPAKLEAALGQPGTARNLRTVDALIDLMGE